MKNLVTLFCPNCNTEYHPGEIYLPNHFLGQPKDIERDIEGKILWVDGIDQDLTESYICPKCNKKFLVKANLSFETKLGQDLTEDYVSQKYTDRINLEEGI